jgi:hypothetical protein
MHPHDEPASPEQTLDQTLRQHQRLWGIGKAPRAAWHRFHWGSEDTLALLIVAITVLVICMMVLQP